ncbi:MAG: hypothetical protein HOV81_13225 [Kofleriaceae bacterium]|nr:hypothetical protein [Kofleriaceae bacterium]
MARLSLVLTILIAFVTSAGADSKVDWSKYIDPNPSAPVRSSPARVAGDPAPAKAKAAKTKKKPAPKRKAKARSKAKSRHR